MAETTVFIDDLTGEMLPTGYDARRIFGWEEKTYRIDLSEDNQKAFKAAMQPYLDAASEVVAELPRDMGRPAPRTRVRKAAAAVAPVAPVPSGDASENALARAWYRDQGGEIGERGRLPKHVLAGYRDALAAGSVPAEFMPGAELPETDGGTLSETLPVLDTVPAVDPETDEPEETEDEEAEDGDDAPEDDGETAEPVPANANARANARTPQIDDPFGERDGVPVAAAPAAPVRRRRGVAKSA